MYENKVNIITITLLKLFVVIKNRYFFFVLLDPEFCSLKCSCGCCSTHELNCPIYYRRIKEEPAINENIPREKLISLEENLLASKHCTPQGGKGNWKIINLHINIYKLPNS